MTGKINRTAIFTLDGTTGSQSEYIQCLLKTSTGKDEAEDIKTSETVDLLTMEAGYQTGEKSITAAPVELCCHVSWMALNQH